jgi:hypothetical protein
MSEHEHEHDYEHDWDSGEVLCIHCGGAKTDPNEIARGMIEVMTRDFAANPDLAAKLWLTLKLAAEQK